MKRVLSWIGVVALIATSIGCSTCDCQKCRSTRNACGPFAGLCGGGNRHGGGGGGGGLHHGQQNFGPGPMTPTVAYPYYTTRGPRDFLSANPRGIGP